jgi:hypothetical protein
MQCTGVQVLPPPFGPGAPQFAPHGKPPSGRCTRRWFFRPQTTITPVWQRPCLEARLPRPPQHYRDLADLTARQPRADNIQTLLNLRQHHHSHFRPSLGDGTTNRTSGWARHDRLASTS